jgi:hypothetical protein
MGRHLLYTLDTAHSIGTQINVRILLRVNSCDILKYHSIAIV